MQWVSMHHPRYRKQHFQRSWLIRKFMFIEEKYQFSVWKMEVPLWFVISVWWRMCELMLIVLSRSSSTFFWSKCKCGGLNSVCLYGQWRCMYIAWFEIFKVMSRKIQIFFDMELYQFVHSYFVFEVLATSIFRVVQGYKGKWKKWLHYIGKVHVRW